MGISVIRSHSSSIATKPIRPLSLFFYICHMHPSFLTLSSGFSPITFLYHSHPYIHPSKNIYTHTYCSSVHLPNTFSITSLYPHLFNYIQPFHSSLYSVPYLFCTRGLFTNPSINVSIYPYLSLQTLSRNPTIHQFNHLSSHILNLLILLWVIEGIELLPARKGKRNGTRTLYCSISRSFSHSYSSHSLC